MVSIDIMLSKPGIYVIAGNHCFIFVEVDANGKAYQLEPHSGKYMRDGELQAGGWRLADIGSIDGPFARSQP